MVKRLVPCYEVSVLEIVHRGIPVNGQNEIVLGEEGPGRIKTVVPIPEGSVLQGELVYEMPVAHPTATAVVAIRDLSGYRGTWRLVKNLPGDIILEYARTRNLQLVTASAEPADPPLLIAYGRKGGGDELLFIGRPWESYDIIRLGQIKGRPRLLRLNILDDRVELIDLVQLARQVDMAGRW
jgi:hypothetical protein